MDEALEAGLDAVRVDGWALGRAAAQPASSVTLRATATPGSRVTWSPETQCVHVRPAAPRSRGQRSPT
jgi:hypothetical protein